jgi:hypothetical protein
MEACTSPWSVSMVSIQYEKLSWPSLNAEARNIQLSASLSGTRMMWAVGCGEGGAATASGTGSSASFRFTARFTGVAGVESASALVSSGVNERERFWVGEERVERVSVEDTDERFLQASRTPALSARRPSFRSFAHVDLSGPLERDTCTEGAHVSALDERPGVPSFLLDARAWLSTRTTCVRRYETPNQREAVPIV